MQKFSGEGNTPPQTPPPSAPSIFAPMALKLNVTPLEKIPVTALYPSICNSFPVI